MAASETKCVLALATLIVVAGVIRCTTATKESSSDRAKTFATTDESAADPVVSFIRTAKAIAARLDDEFQPYRDSIGVDLDFWVDDSTGWLHGFDVFDLRDTSNHYAVWGDSVYFANGHAYHVYAVYPPVSFSNLAVIRDAELTFFDAINCLDRGSDIADVLAFVRAGGDADGEYLRRITNYRSFGEFRLIDPIVPSLHCACSICYLPDAGQ